MGTITGFISPKGGNGKSTLAQCAGQEAAANNLSVKIADFDVQQGTYTDWYGHRLETRVEPIFLMESFKIVFQAPKLAPQFDYLIIDRPAQANCATLEIARAAPLFVQPTDKNVNDIKPAILTFHDLIRAGIS